MCRPAVPSCPVQKTPGPRAAAGSLLFLLILSVCLSACTPAESEKEPFRACLFYDLMPLSDRQADPLSGERGLYYDLAQLLATEMDKRLEVVFPMSAFYTRPVREGLLKDQCDAQFGLPREHGDWYIRGSVLLTQPLGSIGYALVLPRSKGALTLGDLAGRDVGVQGGSPPQLLLADIDSIKTQTFLSADEALQALQAGDIDAAFVWGPRAGYLNRYRYGNSFRVTPSDLSWPVSIGVRADNTLLKEKLDRLLNGLSDQLRQLRSKYGFPYGEQLITRDTPEDVPGEKGPWAAAPGADSDDIRKGRSLFHATLGCAHCHGPNARAAQEKMDLRFLKKRHGQMAARIFRETVMHGRPGTEMPEWNETFAGREEWLNQVQAYIFSIQIPSQSSP